MKCLALLTSITVIAAWNNNPSKNGSSFSSFPSRLPSAVSLEKVSTGSGWGLAIHNTLAIRRTLGNQRGGFGHGNEWGDGPKTEGTVQAMGLASAQPAPCLFLWVRRGGLGQKELGLPAAPCIQQ